jgi:hypothetical protein
MAKLHNRIIFLASELGLPAYLGYSSFIELFNPGLLSAQNLRTSLSSLNNQRVTLRRIEVKFCHLNHGIVKRLIFV